MKDWEIRDIETQRDQVAADTMIVLEQINKLQASKSDEILAIRRALAAIYNGFDMLNAITGTLLRAVRDDD